jgi:hypothetical protein
MYRQLHGQDNIIFNIEIPVSGFLKGGHALSSDGLHEAYIHISTYLDAYKVNRRHARLCDSVSNKAHNMAI